MGLIVSLLLDFFFLSSPPPLAVTRLCFHVTNAFAPPPNPYAKHVPHLSPFSLCTLPHAESAAARRPGASRLAEFASGGVNPFCRTLSTSSRRKLRGRVNFGGPFQPALWYPPASGHGHFPSSFVIVMRAGCANVWRAPSQSFIPPMSNC